MVPVTNFWWKSVSKDEFKKAFRTQALVDRIFLRIVHYMPSLTYLFLSHPWIPKANGLNPRPEVLNASDREVLQTMSRWPVEKLAEVTTYIHMVWVLFEFLMCLQCGDVIFLTTFQENMRAAHA